MPRQTAFALLFLLAAAPSLADTLLTVRSSIQGLKIAPSQAAPTRIWIHGTRSGATRGTGRPATSSASTAASST